MRPSPRKRWFGTTVEILVLVGVVAVMGFALMLMRRSQATTNSTVASQVTQTNETATPNVAIASPDVSPSSSITAYPAPPTVPVPSPSPLATPRPEDPVRVRACGIYDTSIRSVVDLSPIVVRGVVKQILPAQWSTPDGKRPPNPHARDQLTIIYRPVVLQVEEYLNNALPEQTLVLFARGGTVGQDTHDYCGDTRYAFQEREQVLLFLRSPEAEFGPVPPPTPGGPPVYAVGEHYTLTQDGQAFNPGNPTGKIPLQQLLDEIQAALAAPPLPTPPPLPTALPSPAVAP